jgi:hypothetical protein
MIQNRLLVQNQRQQQLASSTQLQQNSLTLNQQQLPQLMQRRSMGQPQLQQQLQHQLIQQQHQQQHLLQQQKQLQRQYQRLQQPLASSAQLQQNSLTLNQDQLPQLMQRKSMGKRQLQQQLQQLRKQRQQQQVQLLQQQHRVQLLQQQLQSLGMPGS